ncbi:MAG: divalent-cation tolerance protein CutA [Hyphomicrobiaceae bacterium]
MGETDGPVLIYVTFPDFEKARDIARALVEARVAACVNVLGPMTSVYRWEGRIAEDGEVAALVKTRATLATAVTEFVRERHPYQNPAIVVLPVAGGSAPFLAWIGEETAAGA